MIAGLFLIDRLTKWLALNNLPREGVFLIPKVTGFVLERNQGIAYSVPIPSPVLIAVVTFILLVLFIILIKAVQKKELMVVLSISLIIIGAFSNLLDRLQHGYVVDMIVLTSWPVFNLADIFILAGGIWLILKIYKSQQFQSSCVSEKGSGEMNEDRLVVKENLFCVIDGASSLNGYHDSSGKTGGYLAASVVREKITGGQGTLIETVTNANTAIAEAMIKNNIDVSNTVNRWSASLVAVRIKDETAEWIKIGDCNLLVLNQDGSVKLLGEYHNHDLETLKMWKALAQKKTKNIRQHLREQNRKVRMETNIKYGALNGDNRAISFIQKGEISVKGVKNIILFTDGFLIPKEDPEESEDFFEMVELFRQGGLNMVRQTIRDLEKSDPECWKYPRLKQYDDMAAIVVKL